MMGFFRFPRTPHLVWLGEGVPRHDKLLNPTEVDALLARELVIEEKVDGANVGLSVDRHGSVRAQNRGAYISPNARHRQFAPLFGWIAERHSALVARLQQHLVLFGEWCYATHSAHYTALPDWFLAFDVYDRARKEFWSSARRDELVREIGLSLVPCLATGRLDLHGILRLLGASRLGEVPAEGLYVRADEGDYLFARAKLVRPGFLQSAEAHWSRRALVSNELTCGARRKWIS